MYVINPSEKEFLSIMCDELPYDIIQDCVNKYYHSMYAQYKDTTILTAQLEHFCYQLGADYYCLVDGILEITSDSDDIDDLDIEYGHRQDPLASSQLTTNYILITPTNKHYISDDKQITEQQFFSNIKLLKFK